MGKVRCLIERAALVAGAVVVAAVTAPFAAAQEGSASYQPANPLESQVEAVGRLAGPSVVNITSTIIGKDFFSQPVPSQAVGSGFVYDRQGHIVTNYHVVEKAQSVAVSLKSGTSYPAKVVGTDASTDLAVLEVTGVELPAPLSLGSSSRVQVGQFVVALGNPFGLTHTLTFGVISALGRVIQSPDGRFIGEALQTDTPINPGNSGGPLLTLGGEVIGVNSQIISPSGSSSGIGFAIPVNLVKRIVPQLIAKGKADHPWLGVSVLGLSSELRAALTKVGISVPVSKGLLVLSVEPGSPAAHAGIRGGSQEVRLGNAQLPIKGDVIVSIDGQEVSDLQQLSVYLEMNTVIGQSVEVVLYRDASRMEVTATLAPRPPQL